MQGWRYFFYYVLGLLPSVFFSLRFLIQWIGSEKRKKSFVTPTFWYLSLYGNLLCALHYFIQIQFLLMVIQVINGFIAWRNLALIHKVQKATWKKAVFVLASLIAASSALFFAQAYILSIPLKILEIPFGLANHRVETISIFWHLMGSMGCLLFASRFWIQWLDAEKTGRSELGKNFWVVSLIGSLIALIYFLHIKDWVSSLNYSFGVIPYIRNLMLSRKTL